MANAIIRQEINILDSLLSAAGGASATSSEIVQLDTTQYNGATYYFEVVADSSVSLSFNVTLQRGATVDATCNIPLLTTAYTRVRSAAFTPGAATANYTVVIDNTAGATKNVKSARIIIIQNAASITKTETQIEVGNKTTTIATVATAITDAKYWKYTAANWDGTKTFYAEATYACSASKSAMTISLQEDNGSFGAWADIVTIVSAGTATTATRVRSVAFTPTDGRNYRIAVLVGNSKSLGNIYNAKVIIDQNRQDSTATSGGNASNIQGGTASSGQLTQAAGMSFTTVNSYSLTSIALIVYKSFAPTDNLAISIYSTSITGTLLGTSDNVAGANLTNGFPGTYQNFNFSTPVSLSATTKYYLQIKRDGARDTTNYFLALRNTTSTYANGGAYSLDNNTWSSESTTDDLCLITFGGTDITKLEPQYLLLNTADAGTGEQDMDTLWDSSEWNDTQGGLPTFKYSHDATNAADSSKLRDTTAGADVSGATVTGANQQISSAFTMPTTGDTLDTNVTVSTGVVGAVRVLAIYAVNSVAAVPNRIYQYCQAINRSNTF